MQDQGVIDSMSGNIQHGKRIVTETYYEGEVTKSKEEREIGIFTDHDHVMQEIITACAIITQGKTKQLDLEISLDAQGRYRIKKKWCIA